MAIYNFLLNRHNKNLQSQWRHGYTAPEREGIPEHVKKRQMAKVAKPCAS